MKGMRCALGNHLVVGTPKRFTDENHISFVKKVRKEFRAAAPVCTKCYNDAIKIYNLKKASAIKKAKEKRMIKNKTNNNVSDPSVTSTVSSSNDNDTIDNMVFRTPRNPNLKSVVSESRTGDDSSSSSSSAITRIDGFLASQSQNVSSTSVSNEGPQQSRQSPLDMEPSTSAAAKRKRAAPTIISDGEQSNEPDPWDDVASPAALSGVRLPNVQPILKRRQFVSANKDVMDIYLSNLTGG